MNDLFGFRPLRPRRVMMHAVDTGNAPGFLEGWRTTAGARFDEWVCGKHWSAVPAADRRLYAAAKRRWRRSPEKWGRVASRVWRRCRDAAVEIAMGLR